jgi:uncharacterized protein YkwD
MNRRTVLAAGVAAVAGCADVAAPQRPDADAAAAQIIDGINEVRAEAGRGALAERAALSSAAADHAADMAARDFYSHTSPDGTEPWDRVACRAGENIHRGELGTVQNVDSDESWDTRETAGLAGYVVEGWVLSDGHYRLMTDTRWQHVGAGVHVGDAEFFATAMFC